MENGILSLQGRNRSHPVTLSLNRVEFMPHDLEPGVLYYSERFALAIHLCACGCGLETVTPIGAADWSMIVDDELASLSPSILNKSCGAHYWLRHGIVEWT